jgi:hypothetical protein
VSPSSRRKVVAWLGLNLILIGLWLGAARLLWPFSGEEDLPMSPGTGLLGDFVVVPMLVAAAILSAAAFGFALFQRYARGVSGLVSTVLLSVTIWAAAVAYVQFKSSFLWQP